MMPWLQNPNAPKQPGLGQQLGQKVASDFAAKEAAKLGLGAAGTAVAGPLGGIAGNAAGELAGPLASQLVGQLFNEGGSVHMNDGGAAWKAALLQSLRDRNNAQRAAINAKVGDSGSNQHGLALKDVVIPPAPISEEAVVSAPVAQPDRAVGGSSKGGSASWNIPLGKLLGADWSTQGDYASGVRNNDGTDTDDSWNAGLKATWSFDKGGEVPSGKKNSIWDTIKDAAGYAWKNENKLHDSYAAKLNKKPQYKAIGGMTSGPLGMSDALAAGKDKDISKVKIKKNKGDMSEEVEFNYHAPLAPKPTGE